MDADPVRQALARLVDSGELRAEQVEPVALAVREALLGGSVGRVGWSGIVSYVGGGLVLAGAATFVGLGWDRTAQPAKVAVLTVITVPLLAAATWVGTMTGISRSRPAAIRWPNSFARTKSSASSSVADPRVNQHAAKCIYIRM